MAASTMSYDRHRKTNRRAILIGISIWLGAQALDRLDAYGVPDYAASSLAVTGLMAMVPVLIWPWARKMFLKADDEPAISLKSSGTRHEALVSAEIIVLSALLMGLIIWMPE